MASAQPTATCPGTTDLSGYGPGFGLPLKGRELHTKATHAQDPGFVPPCLVLSAWGSSEAQYDVDGDGLVQGGDLGFLLGTWGVCAP